MAQPNNFTVTDQQNLVKEGNVQDKQGTGLFIGASWRAFCLSRPKKIALLGHRNIQHTVRLS